MNTPATAAGQRFVTKTLESAVIRFCGDSGDGMQLTGGEFTTTSAMFGNDVATFPDYPAEIRAPAGTLPGVSGFQVNFASTDIFTPGDKVDVLVAMNPAGLKTNLADLQSGGILIVNEDAFNANNLNIIPLDNIRHLYCWSCSVSEWPPKTTIHRGSSFSLINQDRANKAALFTFVERKEF